MSQTGTFEIDVTRAFSASADDVYDAWLDPARAGQWFFATPDGEMVVCELDGRVGGGFRMTDRRVDGDMEHVGKYLSLDRPREIVFEFGVPQCGPDVSRVVVAIAPREAGCVLTLTQTIDDVWAEYKEQSIAGWTLMLAAFAVSLGE
jgi:uncharacterized protein YndB with AHSA1/START domain